MEYRLIERVYTLTLDNPSNNSNVLVIELDYYNFYEDLFHIICACHIINLIVQDGLKDVGSMLEVIKDT